MMREGIDMRVGQARWMAILFVLLLLSFVVMPVAAANRISVAVNQSIVLTVNGVVRVAVANPDIADVMVVSGSEIMVIGKSPGDTTVQIWSEAGRQAYSVTVAADDAPVAAEIKSILGLKDIKVSKVNKTVILEGKVNSQYQKDRAEKVAKAFGDRVVNLLEITQPVQVKIEAIVLEIDRSKVKNLGIQWGNGTGSDFSAGGFALGQDYTNSIVGNSLGKLGAYANINAQVNALVTDGVARILSRPNMITLSGDKADIMVGGQIPIPVSNQNGQISIEWKDYGVKLNIEPVVNAEGLINSKVKAEVSSLDWNSTHKIQLTSTMYIPPLKMSRAETNIALASGQTMAIGGLISSQMNRDITKIPLLSDLPIIGKLFTSKAFNRDETELLILITPTIVNPDEYVPQATNGMKDFMKENPWGGTENGGQDKSSDR
jgi:pilus assembly protein CpaC